MWPVVGRLLGSLNTKIRRLMKLPAVFFIQKGALGVPSLGLFG
jgi:hypothetical protein